jgi:DNA-binding beta-propeller fold protein YncE
LENHRFIRFLSAIIAAAALAACSNPAQGVPATNASSSILPAVHQSAAIPNDSLFVGATGRIKVFSDAEGGFVPTAEITDHVTHEPRAMGIDRDGDLFVADYSDVSQISLYRLPQDGKYLGALTKGIVRPTALALDARNNLAVVTYNERNRRTVRVFPSAASDGSYELQDVSGPGHLAYDFDGDLFVANADNSSVGMYHPGEDLPAQTISDGVSAPAAFAFDRTGMLYIANFGAFNVTGYKGPEHKLVLTIPTGGLHPLSLATRGKHLYIAAISHLKSEVLDYNLNSGRSTRIVDGIDFPSGVIVCSRTYVCVANRNHKVTIYEGDTLVHTIDVQGPVWSMTTR